MPIASAAMGASAIGNVRRLIHMCQHEGDRTSVRDYSDYWTRNQLGG